MYQLGAFSKSPNFATCGEVDKHSNKFLDKIECTAVKIIGDQRKNSIVETKIKLLAKCTNAIKNSVLTESQRIRHSSFATYVEETFSSLNKRQITISEKRINDVLFELEMPVGNESID